MRAGELGLEHVATRLPWKVLVAGAAYRSHQCIIISCQTCVTLPRLNILGKQVLDWLSYSHMTKPSKGPTTTLYQVGERKDRTPGTSPTPTKVGRGAGTWVYCPIRTTWCWGWVSRGNSLQGNQSADGKGLYTECPTPIQKYVAEDLDLSVVRWIDQDERQRWLRHEGFRGEQFLTSLPSSGTQD